MIKKRQPRRIILTHWNAGAFQASSVPGLLPELIIYALLYDEVLIREEDLLTNRQITRLLSDLANFRIFEELLSAGLVTLLRLPTDAYPGSRRFDPIRLPISARAEEHQLRRSYKGRPWKPTAAEWQLFKRLDQIVAQHPSASRFHAAFPPGNPFAEEIAEILENREQYRLKAHPVFRYLHPKTVDAFIQFCREPNAWQRFLRDSGAKSIIIGPDGAFYRNAAYQCLRLLPHPRTMQRLVESVYAATYCDREDSDGRYSGSELIELPFRYELEEEREAVAETITRVEVVPTGAATALAIGPGIAAVLASTRESQAFEELQQTLDQLGSASSESLLPTDAAFRDVWHNVAEVYAEHWATQFVPRIPMDKRIPRYAVFAYILARVLGFIILPQGPGHLEGPVVADAAAIAAIEKLGPRLARGFRALLKTPAMHQSLLSSASVRCSTVSLNTKGQGTFDQRGM